MVSRIFLIGSPRMFSAGGAPVNLPTMGYALVTALLLSGDAQAARNALADLLWGQSDNRHGNLRKLLWKMRSIQKSLDVEFLQIDAYNVKLALSEVQIDLSQLLALLSGGQPFSLTEICRLYTGELLENIDLDGSEWNDWLAAQRTKLRDAFAAAVARRIEPLAETADSTQIKLAARRLIEIDPYNEAACRALMETFAQEGETAQVQQVFHALRARLETDLQTTPAPATSALFHSLTVGLAPRTWAPIWMSGSDRGPAAGLPPHLLASIDAVPRHQKSSLLSAGVPKICILAPSEASVDLGLLALAGALVDDVTIGLCRLRSLSVLAPHTAWQVAHANTKDDILEQFGVDYVVETRLHSAVAIPKLSVKLFDIRNREIIWADSYPFAADDAARCSNELSMQVISLLSSEIERKELDRYEGIRNPTAYHWYLIGQKCLSSLDLPGIRRGRRALKTAVAACPDFAPAVSALARSYHMEWLLLARGDQDMLAQAEGLARKAVRIDPQDARGYRELGVCNLFAWRFDESLDAYAAGERLNPQHADLIADYADALVHACQVKAALTKIKLAIELNPLCPDEYWWAASGANYFAGDYRGAIDAASHMRNRGPALRLLAASHAMLGEVEETKRYVKKAMDIHPDFTVNKWLEIAPLREPAAIRHYEHGLRLAGFS